MRACASCLPKLSRERTGYNFCARPLPIFIILSNCGRGAISPDTETSIFQRVRKFWSPPECVPVGIFPHVRFPSSSFGLIWVPIRFAQFQDGQSFSVREHISRSSRERNGWTFHARSLPFFVIWPNYGTCAISCDSMTASFLARACGAHRLQFSCMTAFNIRHYVQLGYLCDFAQSRDERSFVQRACVHKFPGPPESAPFRIFPHDRFSSSSIGLITVPIRFHAIPSWSIF